MSSDPNISDAVTKIESGIKSQEDNLENLKGELNSRREKLNYMALEAENENIRFTVKKLEQDLELRNQSLAEANQETHRLGQQKKELQTEIDSIKSKLQESDSKIDQIASDYESKLKSKQDEIDKLKHEHTQKDLKFKQIEDKFTSDLESFKSQVKEISDINLKVTAEKEELIKTLSEDTAKRKTLEETISRLESRIKDLEDSETNLIAQQGQNQDSQAHIKELELTIDQLKTSLTEKDTAVLTLTESLQHQERNNESLIKALEKTEKTCSELQSSLEVLKQKCTEFERTVSETSASNDLLSKEVRELKQEVEDKILQIEKLRFEIERIRTEELITLKINVIDPPPKGSNDELALKVQVSALERELAEKESALKNAWLERKALRDNIDQLNEVLKKTRQENFTSVSLLNEQISILKEEVNVKKLQISSHLQKISALESTLVEKTYIIEELNSGILKKNQEFQERDSQILKQGKEISRYKELVQVFENERKELLQVRNDQELKLKHSYDKIQNMIQQLDKNTQEAMTRDKEIINLNKQLDSVKRKLVYQTSQLKKVSSDQLDSQQKKINEYESQINMLKDMLKGVQNELKNKQREINRMKKSSPSPKPTKKPELSPNKLSPIQQAYRDEINSKLGIIHEMPPRHMGYPNIFKASPQKIDRKFGDKLPLLQHSVKSYLTGFVKCEKDREEIVKRCSKADTNQSGKLDKEQVTGICKELNLDLSFVEGKAQSIDFKQFSSDVRNIQMQQIHQELDKNFMQLTPGSASVSQLKLIKQGLKPVHAQIWGVIVENIQHEYPFEVDFSVIKNKLSRVSITL